MADRFLCLDCATRTGWATNAVPGVIHSGLADFTSNHPGERTHRFRTWLEEQVRSYLRSLPEGDTLTLIYEEPHLRGYAPTRVAIALTSCVDESAFVHHLRFRTIHTQTLKLVGTGYGNASKEQMREVAGRHFLHYGAKLAADPGHDLGADEADALLILRWAAAGFPAGSPKKAAKKPAKPKTSSRRKAALTEDLVLIP